jgi:murein L,D-transpeptidase YafK
MLLFFRQITARQWAFIGLASLLLAGGTTFWLKSGKQRRRGNAVKADKILIEKAERRLTLLRQGQVMKTYRVALGPNPAGHKQEEGDGRTPEGKYRIDWRNPQSKFYLSLHISYPNETDKQRATERGVSPGGDIMIHGLPNGSGSLGSLHYLKDWTLGCIAVNNEEIEEIWDTVDDGIVVEIVP